MPIPPRYLHADLEQLSQPLDFEDLFFRPIRDNTALAHQNDALNFGHDVGKFMRHQNDGRSRSGE
jgi:hypothetical protein